MVVDGLIHLPLVLPPVAVGFLLLTIFGTRAGWAAGCSRPLASASCSAGPARRSRRRSSPSLSRCGRSASRWRAPTGLDEAAETLGAGWFDRLVNITLPLAFPGIVAGVITAFAACLGEFGAIITFVSNIPGETRTLPLAIYTALQTPGGEAEAARLSLLSIVLALIFMTLAEIVQRRMRRS